MIPAAPVSSLHTITVDSPVGPLFAVADDMALLLLEFHDRPMLPLQMDRLRGLYPGAEILPGTSQPLESISRELEAYFDRRLREFKTPIRLEGSRFQVEAWEALLKIPYGETRSYADQAAAIGKPEAVRAIGKANGDNRLAIIVPCHRVIRSDGHLCGYGGGLWRKKKLLDLESGTGNLFAN